MMIAKILDQREENTSRDEEVTTQCFLVRIVLKDYVENLSDDYKDYEIQREIVTNAYLDNLIETVLQKFHIPPIVLIIDNPHEENNNLKIESFKILDGLQRTYRLNAIWKTLNFFKTELDKGNDILSLSPYSLSKAYSKDLANLDSSTKILQRIIHYYTSNRTTEGFSLFDSFENNFQWFEIWSGLSPDAEVSKMLVLNAGHKPVKIKHQLELIFRNLIPLLAKIGFKEFKIVREKEISAIQFSKNRAIGSFHFSQLIAAILSLKEGRPVTTNSAYIQKIQNSDFDSENDSKYFTLSFLKEFINSLIQIDKSVSTEFGDLGVKWVGREVTLVGIYGALGNYINIKRIPLTESILRLTALISQNPSQLNLSQFEDARNHLDLAKVNIGNVNKIAIFSAFTDILNKDVFEAIDWSKYF